MSKTSSSRVIGGLDLVFQEIDRLNEERAYVLERQEELLRMREKWAKQMEAWLERMG